MTHHTDFAIRPARPTDDFDLVNLVDIAGEDLPTHLWQRACVGDETALSIGRKRARREEGAFSYRNGHILERVGGECAGCMIGWGVPICV